jgi:hypothetical protein
MTAFVRPGEESVKNFPFNEFRTWNFTSHAQAFGREPNAWFDRDSPRLI